MTTESSLALLFIGGEEEKLCLVNEARHVVIKLIGTLKKTKSPGSNYIFPCALKKTNNIISGHLVRIFRKSLNTGEATVTMEKVQCI